jgi:uncharacterized membrane protein YgcG
VTYTPDKDAVTPNRSLRVETLLLEHASNMASVAEGTAQPPADAGLGAGSEAELWSSVLSPSALKVMTDPAELYPGVTTTGNDIGDLIDLDLHSPMVCDYPDAQPPNTIPETPPDLFRDLSLSVSGGPDYAPTSIIDWHLPSPTTSRSTPPPNCCFTIALDILARLFPDAPAGCTLPGCIPLDDTLPAPTQARTIDSILSDNKHIIESVTTLLDCPCSQDAYLVSILTLITLKVMGWYAAAAAADDDGAAPVPIPTPTPPLTSCSSMSMSSSSASSTTQPSPSQLGPVQSVQTTGFWSSSTSGSVSPTETSRCPSTSTFSSTSASYNSSSLSEQIGGSYHVSDQQQGQTAAQLVLSELHRVQSLVNALTQRLESIRLRARASQGMACGLESGGGRGGGGERGGGGGARTPPFSVPTFYQLEEDLRKRFRVLSSETIDVLRRG